MGLIFLGLECRRKLYDEVWVSRDFHPIVWTPNDLCKDVSCIKESKYFFFPVNVGFHKSVLLVVHTLKTVLKMLLRVLVVQMNGDTVISVKHCVPQFLLHVIHSKSDGWDFPGGTVVKNPPANARDTGLSPGLGRSHMPQNN